MSLFAVPLRSLRLRGQFHFPISDFAPLNTKLCLMINSFLGHEDSKGAKVREVVSLGKIDLLQHDNCDLQKNYGSKKDGIN